MFARGLTTAVLAVLLTHGAAQAQLTCDAPRFDAGTLRSGSVIRADFRVRNIGNAPVDVRHLKTGCGCTQAVMDRTTLAVGDEATVSVQIHTVTQAAGANRWGVTLRHSSGELPLEVTAQLDRDLTIQPAALVLHTDRAATHTFRLTEAREQPLDIRGAVTSSPHLDASVGQPSRQGAHWLREVTLRVKPDCPPGRHEGILCVHTTDPNCPELRVPYTIIMQTRGAVCVAPSAVEQVAAYNGVLPARIVLLGSGEGQSVLVERVEPDHPAIRCSFCEGPGARSTLRVVVDAAKLPPGSFEGRLRVHLRQPAGATVDVPVRIAR